MSRYTKIVLQDKIPRIKIVEPESTSEKGDILRRILEILKINKFDKYLIEHIITDKNIKGVKGNKIAQKSDQAETP
jgi:hypothetical protein